MFGIVHYGLFLISGIILNITPGADTLYILGRSVSQGRKAGIVSTLGITTGSLIHTLLAAFGLSIILAKSALAFAIVKYCGVAYLIYLGIRTLLAKENQFSLQGAEDASYQKIYLQGIFTNLFNPKVALFFIAFLPQFIDPASSYGPLPFILLGLTFLTTGTAWCILIAVFSALTTDKLRSNPKIAAAFNKLSGALFIGLGLNLLRAKVTRTQ